MALSLGDTRKNRTMKIFAIIILSATLLSCGTTKEVLETEVTETMESTKPERNVMIKATLGEFTTTEPVTIKKIRLEGNTLFIDITITGGCGVHNFKVIGNPGIMKSLPAKRSFKIIHEVPREECSDKVNKILEIDITTLAVSQTPGSEIVLLLDGWEEPISYIFQ